ncbi:MAG: hypothetical protein NT133_00010 [Alphaproteobacteria bacterium]|nr:hypothetical protein [Alphaproteobacteria bacterium]
MNPAPTPPAPHTHAELAALMLRVVVGLVGAMGVGLVGAMGKLRRVSVVQ